MNPGYTKCVTLHKSLVFSFIQLKRVMFSKPWFKLTVVITSPWL